MFVTLQQETMCVWKGKGCWWKRELFRKSVHYTKDTVQQFLVWFV